MDKRKLSENNRKSSQKRWEKLQKKRERTRKAIEARMKKRAEQREKGYVEQQNRGDEGCSDEKAAVMAPISSKTSATKTRHEKCRQRMERAEQELCELRRQLAEQKQWQQMAMQQLDLDQDRIVELENELRVSKAQNDMLRGRFLLEEVVDSPSSSNARLVVPAPTFQLIAPQNPMTTLISRHQSLAENQNPTTTQQFVASLEQQEEEIKDVALLNNNTGIATTTSSSAPTIVEESFSTTTNNDGDGIYAKKRNVNSKEPSARRKGYNLFSLELRKKLLEEYPSIGSGEVYKIVSTEWKRLHFEQKIQYEERAIASAITEERTTKAAQMEQQRQVQPVQQQQQQQHPHYHPLSTSSGSSSTAEECIKEEVGDDV